MHALRGASFTVYPQEVVALVGDNGAGKSTLVKTLVGVHPPDSGQILFDGREVEIPTPHASRELGIETVYQDLSLASELDPAANMFLGREIPRGGLLGRFGFLDKKSMRQRSDEAFRDLGVRIQDVGAPVANMSGGQRQGIAICRAVTWASKVVFMDEPTAALGVVQTRNVLDQIKRVRETRPLRRADQPQPARGLRGRRPDRGPAARQARRAAAPAGRLDGGHRRRDDRRADVPRGGVGRDRADRGAAARSTRRRSPRATGGTG